MAVAIDEMSVEVAPIATAPHGAASATGSPSASGQVDSAALHKMMMVLHERKARLEVS